MPVLFGLTAYFGWALPRRQQDININLIGKADAMDGHNEQDALTSGEEQYQHGGGGRITGRENP